MNGLHANLVESAFRDARLIPANESVRQIEVAPLFESASSSLHRLVIKLAEGELRSVVKSIRDDQSELIFYRDGPGSKPGTPTPRLLTAITDTAQAITHLFLEDLSESHYKTELDIPPTVAESKQMLSALARLHRQWWDHPQLFALAGSPPSDTQIEHAVSHVADCFPKFCDRMSDRLSTERQQICESLFDGRFAAALQRRTSSKSHLTFVHRDAHSWNFLLPLDPSRGKTVLVDWHTHERLWRCWPGVSDIAYWIVHWWFPERRRSMERALLQDYVELLEVHGFGFEEAWADYRLFAMWSLLRPIEESQTAPPWSWYPQFEYAVTAFTDLRCVELLEG